MSEPDILYPAIFVFSMMLLGLLLTVLEFSRLRRSEKEKAGREKPVTGTTPGNAKEYVRNVSNF
jgi:hypothetical protein